MKHLTPSEAPTMWGFFYAKNVRFAFIHGLKNER